MSIWAGLGSRQVTVPAAAPAKAAAPAQNPPPKASRESIKLKEGDHIGLWRLMEYIPGSGAKGTAARIPGRWRCLCSCGTERVVQASNLTNGASQSCGHVSRRGKEVEWATRPIVTVASADGPQSSPSP